MAQFFFSEPGSSVERLQRRVRMQEAALHQAQQDLAAARLREGLPSEAPAFDEAPDAQAGWLSPAHRQMRLDAERRARGLGPTNATDAPATAEFILQSAAKARGEVVELPADPVALAIIAADRKARGEK